MHGLLPRLGFFVDHPGRMPFDAHELMGLLAPRPLLVVAPELDWDHPQEDVVRCVSEAKKAYALLKAGGRIGIIAKYDINRWSARYRDTPQKEVFEWVDRNFR